MAELAELLRNPLLNAALEIVRNEGMPSLPEPVPGVDYGAQTAAMGAFITGWSRALRSLESLTRLTIVPGHFPSQRQFDEPARQRMRAGGIYTEKEIEEIP